VIWPAIRSPSTPGRRRLAGTERIFSRLPGSDFTLTALPSILPAA
jgi:hypothetical protein